MVFSTVDDDFGAIDFGVKSIADDDWQMNGTSLLAMYRFLIMNLFYLDRLSSSTFIRVSYFIYKDVVGKWQTSGIAT
jgi:hypothetical protein